MPAQPVMYVTHSVGMWQGSHVSVAMASSQGTSVEVCSSTVVVVGQQSVVQGTVTLDTLMYKGQTWSVAGGGQVGFGQEAVLGREEGEGFD